MSKDSFTKEQNATLFDFDAVFEHVKTIATQEDVFDVNNSSDMSKALTLFYLQSHFPDLDSYAAMECIVDGSNDQGIDAVYIEEVGDRNIVNIVQTKLSMKREKVLDKRFPGNELVKFLKKFDDYVVNNQFHEFANEQLKVKLNEIYSLPNKTFNIILLTTALAPAAQELTQFFETIDKYNTRKKYVDVEFVGLGDLADLLPNVAEPKVNIKLRFEGNIVETKSGRVQNIVIGRVQGRAIAELVRSEGEQLFTKNVRGFLNTKNNSVNKDIYKTSTDPDEAPYFFVLNNGITIVCDETDYMSGVKSPEVRASGAQIVNGGQTSNSLFEALKADKLQPSVEVLVRIIETKKKDVLDKITKATNSQTSVSNRDLKSNDAVQKRIESYFADKYKHYYEARRNKYQGKQPTKYRVDIEIATQSYYSYHYLKPDFAKSSKSSLFSSDTYDKIFYDEAFSMDEFFFSYKLRRALETLRTQFAEQHSYLRDAEITSLALMSINSKIVNYEQLHKDEKDSYQQLAKDYTLILDATKKVVNEEIADKGDAFEKRRFFIAPGTYGRIHEEIVLSRQ